MVETDAFVGVNSGEELDRQIILNISETHEKIINNYCKTHGYESPHSLIAQLLNQTVSGAPTAAPTSTATTAVPNVASVLASSVPQEVQGVNPFAVDKKKTPYLKFKLIAAGISMLVILIAYYFRKFIFQSIKQRWENRNAAPTAKVVEAEVKETVKETQAVTEPQAATPTMVPLEMVQTQMQAHMEKMMKQMEEQRRTTEAENEKLMFTGPADQSNADSDDSETQEQFATFPT